MNKKTFYLTFGQKSPFNNGWVEILATNKEEAREEAFEVFGPKWSNVYEAEDFLAKAPEFFPAGRQGRVIEAL